MSDFLTHLAARAIAQPTLRPRTRMRFEPQTTEEAPAAAWPQAKETRIALPVAEAGEAPSPVSTPAPGEPTVVHTPPEIITRDVVRTRIEPRVEREIRRTIESRDRITKERERERIIQPETTTIRQRVPHRIEIEKPRVIATREEVAREVEVPVERKTERQRQTRAQAGELALHHQPQQPAPEIHVTIGRVEVRAVTPQQQKRPAPRSAVMTLDDYAAKRKERR